MFWFGKKEIASEVKDLAEQCRQEAEELYRSGKYHCAEAVLLTIKRRFRPEMPDDVVLLVTGFGGGSGSGCICGAVAAGTVALAMVLGEDKKRVKDLTKKLHQWFKTEYGATCCKTILQTHNKICPILTGKVAGKVAEMQTS